MKHVEGLNELNATLKKLKADVGKYTMSAYIAGGKLVESDAKKSIQDRTSGETVTRYRNGGGEGYQHQASSEGDAPNTDTGRLSSSINTEPATNSVFVGTSEKYGKYLEFGTQIMGERPWLAPALNKNTQNIINLQIDAVNRSIRANEKHV